jgi:hypothetical protein
MLRRFDLEYSTFVLLMLLLSPIAWDHYLVILILPIIMLGDWVVIHQRHWHTLCVYLLLVVTLSIPVDALVHPFLVKGRPWVVNPLTGSLLTLALIGLTVWLIRLQTKPVLPEAVDIPSN